MVQSTQATTSDVAYGSASNFVNVQAGSVSVTLTAGGSPATAAQTRTINKDVRYSLVAYGYKDELKSVLIAESTVTPDAGKANVNVLDTSEDIGPVEVYLSQTKDLSVSSLIGSVNGLSSTAFQGMLAGSYYVTVIGANSLKNGVSNDVRFQTSTAITLTALQVLTIILTPGASGVLANAILLTQGSSSSAPVSYLNTTARVRAVTAVPGMAASVVGTNPAGATVTVLASSTTSQYSNYVVASTGTPPTVTVNGATVPVVMDSTDATTGAVTEVAGSLAAGGDYTLMVYLNGSTPKAKLIEDNNTAPISAQGVKFRLVNLASDNQGLQLSMSVNSISVASLVPYGAASDYTEISTPQQTNSLAEVYNGTQLLTQHSQVMLLGNIFTDFVLSVDPNTGVAKDIFRAASGS